MSGKENIETAIANALKDENATSQAVKSLISVNDKEKGAFGSDVELKTDLDEKQICIHTAVDMMSHILAMSPSQFIESPITDKLVLLKERKLLSKDRKSRTEIVEVARNPDMTTINPNGQGGFVKNLFKSKRQQQ